MTSELLEMFSSSTNIDEWTIRMNKYIVPWIGKKGKSYWDIVRFHGYRHGELKELTRPDFAKLIINVCKENLDDTDTASSIKENMQKFAYKDCLRKRTKEDKKQQRPDIDWRYDLLPDAHACRALIKELDDLFDKPLPQNETTNIPTIKERLEDYLKSIVDEQRYAKVYKYPEYCGCTATLSIEQYVKQEFMDERNPSHIIVYECTNEKVDEKKVSEYVGRYCSDPKIKLYICSSHGFDISTQIMARNRNTGLMLINPNYEVTDDCYVVARSIELYAKSQIDYETLRGTRKMLTQFVIADDCGITYSIADILSSNGIAIKSELSIKAPKWTDDYIEQRALELVKDKVDDFIDSMRQYPITRVLPHFDADPEQLLINAGYELGDADLSSLGQLAILDFKNRKVRIDTSQRYNLHRRRYSLAHELGHGTLHSKLNVSVFGESEQTLSISAVDLGYQHKWLEHHANHFAACLLMPTNVVGYLYSYFCQMRFGRNIIQPITLGSQHCQQRDFYQIANPMARYMNVSIDALKWRLVKLGFLRIINTTNNPSTVWKSMDCSIK